jgi:hypothetical protein
MMKASEPRVGFITAAVACNKCGRNHPQQEVLGDQARPRAESRDERTDDRFNHRQHRRYL